MERSFGWAGTMIGKSRAGVALLRIQSGFSLVELVVVMVIISILISIGVPTYQKWMIKNSVERQTKETLTNMQSLRLKAIHNKNRYAVVMDPRRMSFRAYSTANEPLFASGTRVEQVINTPYDIKRVNSGGSLVDCNGEYVVMTETGVIENTLATFVIGPIDSGAAYNCLIVSKGRIQMGTWQNATCSF